MAPERLTETPAETPAEEGTVKPPYRVPSMAEVAAVPWNGYTVASTFSGAGGSSLGYRMAGFRVGWASEFIPAARDVYKLNAAPGTILDPRDIREVSPEDILAALHLEVGDLDLLDGSPPCASFSTAGNRQAGWGQSHTYSDTEQRTDDLFFEFTRILAGVQPRVFVAENVSGLVQGPAKGYFKEIMRAMKRCGYQVHAKLLDAQWLGVPQSRRRLIFIGVRDDLHLQPAHPAPLGYRYTVREALPWILTQGDNGGFGAGAMREATVPSGTIGATPQTGNGRYPPAAVVGPVIHDTAGKLSFSAGDITDRPAPTVTAQSSKHFHVGRIPDPDTPPDPEAARVVHDTSGQFSSGDVTDKPSPTVTVGPRSINSRHYQVIGLGTWGESHTLDDPAPTVLTHGRPNGYAELSLIQEARGRDGEPSDAVDPETGESISITGYALARDWDYLTKGGPIAGRRYQSSVLAHPDQASPTVTGKGGSNPGTAGVMHPTQRRKFTLLELRRICGFPDDFALSGTYAQRWERLGRAVPPVMMSHIAATIREEILDRLPRDGAP